ncbi:MAG: esterase family protein [Oscillospiraceae bacterium]|nr:esterase family protein [Oscillospiraceae bacterium]
METNYFENWSGELGRTMPLKIYGHAGKPVLFIPCQDGRFFDFENFGMTDTFAPWIDSGQCMVFSIDTVDAETWSDRDGDPYLRIRRHEQWINYITREVVPFARDWTNRRNGWDGYPGLMSFGCSMGATHALNLYLRFPDLFDRCLALSGVYNASYFLGDYMDEVVYRNSPTDYMANLPADHPFIEEYNRHRAVVCVGQGAWEEQWSTRELDRRFHELGINIWVDFWGPDVNHDWPWWHKQVPYFLPYLL